MYLKRIMTRNIQNHREVVIDLPPTGLVLFVGDNSNGKSVIVRVTRDLLLDNIRKPQCRADLVNRKASFGEVTYTRNDNVVLTLHLAREAANTYVSLTRPNDTPIVRYLADKNYSELVQQFGWLADKESGISLNIAEGDDAILFYKTHPKTVAKLIQSVTTDPIAETALESMQTVIKDTRSFRDKQADQARMLASTINDLHVGDIDTLKTKVDKLRYYYRNLSVIKYPKIPEIKAVPNVKYVNVAIPVIPKIVYPRVINIACTIPNIVPLARDLQALRDRRCPTCGRGWDCAC